MREVIRLGIRDSGSGIRDPGSGGSSKDNRRRAAWGGALAPPDSMRRVFRHWRGHRQIEIEDGATSWRPAMTDGATQGVDDAVADRQAQASALAHRLGGEERLK